MKVIAFLLQLAMLFGQYLMAGIIHVPAALPSIQQAISRCGSRDTVLVAEGIYYENLNFLGKSLTIASHFILDGDTGLVQLIANCIGAFEITLRLGSIPLADQRLDVAGRELAVNLAGEPLLGLNREQAHELARRIHLRRQRFHFSRIVGLVQGAGQCEILGHGFWRVEVVFERGHDPT